jgi:uncharacterized membrane protein YgcG
MTCKPLASRKKKFSLYYSSCTFLFLLLSTLYTTINMGKGGFGERGGRGGGRGGFRGGKTH